MKPFGLRQGVLVLATALLSLLPHSADARRSSPISTGQARIDGRVVHYVLVKLPRVQIEAALGGAEVGQTSWLSDIAHHDRALAAINGGYFECYKPAARKNLDQTTVIDGSVVFKGDVGSVLFFDRENHAYIQRLPLRIDGSLDGSDAWPNNWYAYWINRMPGPTGDTITIFTPAWGSETGLSGGPQVQVTDNTVTAINYGSTVIPRDGYVVYFRGEQQVASHFRIGRHAAYTITSADGGPVGDFSNAWEAIGGGPQVLVEGSIFSDPAAEGFTSPKIYGEGIRSLVGVSQDESELILASATCGLAECGRIMKTLGAYDAMNLDGGASSGLWANGRYLVPPGRQINNALVIR